jgi:hypothetical protein
VTRPSHRHGAHRRPPTTVVQRAVTIVPVAVLAVVVAILAVGVPTPARAAPPTPVFGPAIDAYARYDPQRTCDPTAKPGVVDVRDLLNRTYGVHASGIARPCGSGTSEHYEGRALDYMLNVDTPADRAVADDLLTWLLATDQYSNRHAMARRLGVMYVIWNKQIWGAYRADEGWRSRPCDGTPSDCHTNHIHVSFSWAGASEQTSWWTGAPA